MNNKFIKSFTFAVAGFAYAFRSQFNMKFHIVAAILVIGASAFFRISAMEFCIVLFCIGSVFGAELINTSLEVTVDIASPEFNEKAGHAKDLAAAAVLVVSVVSVIIGLIIFLPKIILLFR